MQIGKQKRLNKPGHETFVLGFGVHRLRNAAPVKLATQRMCRLSMKQV